MLASAGDNAGSDRLYLAFRSTVSGRHSTLEDDGGGVWLYLTSPTDTKPVADCFVYSVVPPTEELFTPHALTGPPVLLRRFASDVAAQPDIPANAHRTEFSPDGDSVAVFIRGEPWAFIAHGTPRGYSKSLSSVCPFGQPWSQELFDALFPATRSA